MCKHSQQGTEGTRIHLLCLHLGMYRKKLDRTMTGEQQLFPRAKTDLKCADDALH